MQRYTFGSFRGHGRRNTARRPTMGGRYLIRARSNTSKRASGEPDKDANVSRVLAWASRSPSGDCRPDCPSGCPAGALTLASRAVVVSLIARQMPSD